MSPSSVSALGPFAVGKAVAPTDSGDAMTGSPSGAVGTVLEPVVEAVAVDVVGAAVVGTATAVVAGPGPVVEAVAVAGAVGVDVFAGAGPGSSSSRPM